MKYYAVKVGRKTGVFANWGDCHESTYKFPSAVFKGFGTEKEATAWLAKPLPTWFHRSELRKSKKRAKRQARSNITNPSGLTPETAYHGEAPPWD